MDLKNWRGNQLNDPEEAKCPKCRQLLLRLYEGNTTILKCSAGCGGFNQCSKCTRAAIGDSQRGCILHAAQKPVEPVNAFSEEIADILEFARRINGTANYSGIIFFEFERFWDEGFPPLCFDGAIFHKGVAVRSARSPRVSFEGARIGGPTDFYDSDFRETNFKGCTFEGVTSFKGAGLANADFSDCVFKADVDFEQTYFSTDARFCNAQFARKVDFAFSQFGSTDEEAKPQSVDFSGVVFEKPELVRFHHLNYEHGQGFLPRFENCDLKDVRFSDVRWFRKDGRIQLQDERRLLRILEWLRKPKDYHPEGEELTYHQVSHEDVAIVYRKLMMNFEDQRLYDLAEECFIGVMEMKRQDPQSPKHLTIPLRIYKAASIYGSSYQRAFVWLVVLVFLVFPILFALPFAGVTLTSGVLPDVQLHEHSVYEGFLRHIGGLTYQFFNQVRHILVRSELVSLEVVTLQRQPGYLITQPFGNFVRAFENVLVPAQLALLLLALRRHFRMT